MSSRHLAAPLVLSLLVSGCTAAGGGDPRPAPPDVHDAPAIKLVGYENDCRRLTQELRKAAQQSVGPWGLGNGVLFRARGAPEAAAGAPAADAAAEFSGTNVHETGADEPDVVKTDGRRIVTVDRGVLRVVDTASRAQTGRLDLGLGPGRADLLLSGDRALVLAHTYRGAHLPVPGFAPTEGTAVRADRAELILVDLAAAPRVTSRYTVDAALVDARQTGGTARVVVRNSPQITFPDVPWTNDGARTNANRNAIGSAPIEAWLPRYEIRTGDTRREGRIACDRVRTPPRFSGASLVTVLTFDLGKAAFSDGDPVTLAADGDTVYGTPTSLYVAHDEGWLRWRDPQFPGNTEIFRFDLSTARAQYRSAGTVPGRLINQYAMSERDGYLRVATTVGRDAGSESRVTVLRLDGGSLRRTGSVGGLGRTEQIQAVRFLGDRGYVVTFRRTDPLYVLDLADPARPRVTGELKIHGYSAHLQPVGPDQLVGIGQDADDHGVQLGTQVSLFDVRDPASPARLSRHRVRGGWSEAESDPHAVLWWPATRLLVVPVQRYAGNATDSEALALRVEGDGFTQLGAVTHPGTTQDGVGPTIRRTLVTGSVLWTVSDAGLQANDLTTLARLAWLPR